jgi:Tol biopolymer transport system component
MRRLSPALAVLALLALCAAANAQAPPGPRIAFTRVTTKPNHSGNPFRSEDTRSAIFTADATGGAREPIAHGRSFASGPAWSPDGSTLAFTKNEGGDVFVAGADGTGLRRLIANAIASSPVFSADGRTIYFARTNPDIDRSMVFFPVPDTAIWRIGIDGSGFSLLTPQSNKEGDLPTSASPNGQQLAITHFDCGHPVCRSSVRLMPPLGGPQTTIVDQAADAVFSPDGSKLALLSYRDRNWVKHPKFHRFVIPLPELYVLDLGSGEMRRLTTTRRVGEGAPSWDPSGQRLIYEADSLKRTSLVAINADGTCKTLIAKGKRARNHFFQLLLNPVWQPGPGRAAGPIAC